MTKEKKATKTTSKAKSVKVKYNQYDTIVNMGPAYDYEALKDIEVTLMEKAAVEKLKQATMPLYKRVWRNIKKLFNH